MTTITNSNGDEGRIFTPLVVFKSYQLSQFYIPFISDDCRNPSFAKFQHIFSPFSFRNQSWNNDWQESRKLHTRSDMPYPKQFISFALSTWSCIYHSYSRRITKLIKHLLISIRNSQGYIKRLVSTWRNIERTLTIYTASHVTNFNLGHLNYWYRYLGYGCLGLKNSPRWTLLHTFERTISFITFLVFTLLRNKSLKFITAIFTLQNQLSRHSNLLVFGEPHYTTN